MWLALIVLTALTPCFAHFLSVWIEGLWLRRKLATTMSSKILHTAHVASYLYLIAQIYIQYPIPLLAYGRFWTLVQSLVPKG